MTKSKITSEVALLAMIKRSSELCNEALRFDELSRKLSREGDATEAREAAALREANYRQAVDLENQIATASVDTPAAFREQLKAIVNAGFQEDDLVLIAFLAGRNMERLGIRGEPSFVHGGQRLRAMDLTASV